MYRFMSIELKGKWIFKGKTIHVDLLKRDRIPVLSPDTVKKVSYEYAGFKSHYPNGQGYFGETFVHSSTFDGVQSIYIEGPTLVGVNEAMERLEKNNLPSLNWEEAPTRKSPKVIYQQRRSCIEEEELHDAQTNVWGGPA